MRYLVRRPIIKFRLLEHIRDIRDPEHPHSLEALNVVRKEDITVDDAGSKVAVQFTPTIPHCSMATLIGLSIKVKLMRSLPRRFKVGPFLQCFPDFDLNYTSVVQWFRFPFGPPGPQFSSNQSGLATWVGVSGLVYVGPATLI